MPAIQAVPALVSVLGVESWGPLTLLLSRDGDPAALAQRLRRAWWQAATAVGDPQPTAGQLLAVLLRHQGHVFRPLGSGVGASLPPDLAYRHRLRVPRCSRCLCWRSWQLAAAERLWRPCGAEQQLDRSFVARTCRRTGGPTAVAVASFSAGMAPQQLPSGLDREIFLAKS